MSKKSSSRKTKLKSDLNEIPNSDLLKVSLNDNTEQKQEIKNEIISEDKEEKYDMLALPEPIKEKQHNWFTFEDNQNIESGQKSPLEKCSDCNKLRYKNRYNEFVYLVPYNCDLNDLNCN